MAKKEVKKEKIEREYTIPLRTYWKRVPRYKRTNRAIKGIKEFLVQHMKIRDRDLKKIKLDRYLNELVWFRGIRSPPTKIQVKAVKEGDIVRVELIDHPARIKFKKAREEKRETAGLDAIEKKKSLVQKAKEGIQQKPKEETHADTLPSKSEEEGTSEEDKNKEKEKKSAVVEAGAKMEKAAAKQSKHVASAKMKQPKRPQRKSLAK